MVTPNKLYRSACLLKIKLRDLMHRICKDSHGGMGEPIFIMLPRLCYFHPITTGFTGVYIIFLISYLNINCVFSLVTTH